MIGRGKDEPYVQNDNDKKKNNNNKTSLFRSAAASNAAKIIFSAIMILHEWKHFIVLDRYGIECQRLHLNQYYTYAFRLEDPRFYPYSLYHMSDYSFNSNKLFIATRSGKFYVLSDNHTDSFTARPFDLNLYRQRSMHILWNSSLVWYLGGETWKSISQYQTHYYDLE